MCHYGDGSRTVNPQLQLKRSVALTQLLRVLGTSREMVRYIKKVFPFIISIMFEVLNFITVLSMSYSDGAGFSVDAASTGASVC